MYSEVTGSDVVIGVISAAISANPANIGAFMPDVLLEFVAPFPLEVELVAFFPVFFGLSTLTMFVIFFVNLDDCLFLIFPKKLERIPSFSAAVIVRAYI